MTESRDIKKSVPAAWETVCAAGRKMTGLAEALQGGWVQTVNVARSTVRADRSWLPSLRRGGLFRKYAALLVALVGIALIISAAIQAYYSFRESRDALIAVQREKAQGTAALIEQFVKEIEAQLSWTAGFLPTGGGIEQRRLDFLRLLRQAPAITEVTLRRWGRPRADQGVAACDGHAGERHRPEPGTQVRPCQGQQALHWPGVISARSRSPISRWRSRVLGVVPA